jgi:hypothetical protein
MKLEAGMLRACTYHKKHMRVTLFSQGALPLKFKYLLGMAKGDTVTSVGELYKMVWFGNN